MSRTFRYGEPYSWWGPVWARAEWRTIGDLLRDETSDIAATALLWAALARRRSLAVIAGPSGAGKTTLLGALLDLLPADTRRIYIRGSFESFSFMTAGDVVPRRTALIVNEISPHLPVYLWGPAVGRLLDAASQGFSLLATAHAESVPAFVGLLAGPPLRVAAASVAAFEFIVLLDRDSERTSGRRVRGIWQLSPARDGVAIEPLWPHGGDGAITSFAPGDELAHRAQLLARLASGELAGVGELHAASDMLFAPAMLEPAM